jgi:hypothetical protein
MHAPRCLHRLRRADSWNKNGIASLGFDIYKLNTPCFHAPCQTAGNVLDLWCAMHGLSLYDDARHLAATFGLKLNRNSEEKNP